MLPKSDKPLLSVDPHPSDVFAYKALTSRPERSIENGLQIAFRIESAPRAVASVAQLIMPPHYS
jgi:hypothetical protein